MKSPGADKPGDQWEEMRGSGCSQLQWVKGIFTVKGIKGT